MRFCWWCRRWDGRRVCAAGHTLRRRSVLVSIVMWFSRSVASSISLPMPSLSFPLPTSMPPMSTHISFSPPSSPAFRSSSPLSHPLLPLLPPSNLLLPQSINPHFLYNNLKYQAPRASAAEMRITRALTSEKGLSAVLYGGVVCGGCFGCGWCGWCR
jgi:hypothetical protein